MVMKKQLNKINLSIASIHDEIETIVQSIVGSTSIDGFKSFVNQSWKQGEFLYFVDQSYYDILHFINDLDKDNRFDTKPFYLPHQLPSTSTLLYTKQFAARLVHDSPDEQSRYLKFSEYNIEPHHHKVDSIIIATSKHKLMSAKFIIHDRKLGFDTVIEVPFDFGSVICLPRFVDHTVLPSDVGISTLNITETYIQPNTNGFSQPSKYNFDEAKVMSYQKYINILKMKQLLL
jgi:hypothetical protein